MCSILVSFLFSSKPVMLPSSTIDSIYSIPSTKSLLSSLLYAAIFSYRIGHLKHDTALYLASKPLRENVIISSIILVHFIAMYITINIQVQ